jgi:hypothetical protein
MSHITDEEIEAIMRNQIEQWFIGAKNSDLPSQRPQYEAAKNRMLEWLDERIAAHRALVELGLLKPGELT